MVGSLLPTFPLPGREAIFEYLSLYINNSDPFACPANIFLFGDAAVGKSSVVHLALGSISAAVVVTVNGSTLTGEKHLYRRILDAFMLDTVCDQFEMLIRLLANHLLSGPRAPVYIVSCVRLCRSWIMPMSCSMAIPVLFRSFCPCLI